MPAITLNARAKRLVRAGLLKPRRLTLGDIRRFNKLSSAEVSALISARRKLGRGVLRHVKLIGFIIF